MKDLELFIKFFLIAILGAFGLKFCALLAHKGLQPKAPVKSEQRLIQVLQQKGQSHSQRQQQRHTHQVVTVTRERFEPKTQKLVERIKTVSQSENVEQVSRTHSQALQVSHTANTAVSAHFTQPAIGFGLGFNVSPSGAGPMATYSLYAVEPFRINAIASWNLLGQPGPRLGFSLGAEILPRLDAHVILQAGLFQSPVSAGIGPLALEPAIGLSYRF